MTPMKCDATENVTLLPKMWHHWKMWDSNEMSWVKMWQCWEMCDIAERCDTNENHWWRRETEKMNKEYQ